MSGAGKQLAQKAVKEIDWESLSRIVVSEEGKREMNKLRRAFDDVRNLIHTKFNKTRKPIDWEFYKARLNPTVVEAFQQAHATLELPKYEDTHTPEYVKKFDGLMARAAEMEEESKRQIVKCDQELKRIKEEKEAMKTMTADEYFAKHPDVKAKFDEEIKNQNWGY